MCQAARTRGLDLLHAKPQYLSMRPWKRVHAWVTHALDNNTEFRDPRVIFRYSRAAESIALTLTVFRSSIILDRFDFFTFFLFNYRVEFFLAIDQTAGLVEKFEAKEIRLFVREIYDWFIEEFRLYAAADPPHKLWQTSLMRFYRTKSH